MTAMKVKKMRIIIMLAITVALIGVGSSGTGLSQPQPQPPAAASLNFLVSLFMKQTVEKFDSVFFQGRVITGAIKNTELTFLLEDGQSAVYKTSEIAALGFELDRVYIVLQSGKRLIGRLLAALEIVPAGLGDQRITFPPVALERAFAIVLLKGQLQHLNTAEFQEVLNRVLNLLARHDVLVLKNDGVLAGIVTNQVFQINDLFFNKQDIAEITCGPPDQLRPWVGPVVVGSIQSNLVTLDVIDAQMSLALFINLRVNLAFPMPMMARILFLDRTATFLPSERWISRRAELIP